MFCAGSPGVKQKVERERVMKKLIAICLMSVLNATVGFADQNNPTTNEGGNSDPISWDHWSPLTVNETITVLGGSLYRYEYSFVNVDSSPIWTFGVDTTFVTQGSDGGTLFTGHSSWGGPYISSMDDVFPQYDARNLNSAIVGLTNTWTKPFVDDRSAIQVGEHASGFSFIASTYDPSPKYYFYETIASGYTQTNGTGMVAAVGLTPEPATIVLFGLGSTVLLRKRKV
jgi:hypothetical protein